MYVILGYFDWSLLCVTAGFEKIYRKLGVTLTERGESFYQSMMSETVQDLESKGNHLHVLMDQYPVNYRPS